MIPETNIPTQVIYLVYNVLNTEVLVYMETKFG